MASAICADLFNIVVLPLSFTSFGAAVGLPSLNLGSYCRPKLDVKAKLCRARPGWSSDRTRLDPRG